MSIETPVTPSPLKRATLAIHDTAQRTRIALKDTAAITQEKAKHTIRQLKITAAFAFDTALQWLPHVSIGRGAVTAALIGSTTILASSQRPYTGEILSVASPAIVIPATDHSQDLGVSLMAQFPEQLPMTIKPSISKIGAISNGSTVSATEEKQLIPQAFPSMPFDEEVPACQPRTKVIWKIGDQTPVIEKDVINKALKFIKDNELCFIDAIIITSPHDSVFQNNLNLPLGMSAYAVMVPGKTANENTIYLSNQRGYDHSRTILHEIGHAIFGQIIESDPHNPNLQKFYYDVKESIRRELLNWRDFSNPENHEFSLQTTQNLIHRVNQGIDPQGWVSFLKQHNLPPDTYSLSPEIVEKLASQESSPYTQIFKDWLNQRRQYPDIIDLWYFGSDTLQRFDLAARLQKPFDKLDPLLQTLVQDIAHEHFADMYAQSGGSNTILVPKK